MGRSNGASSTRKANPAAKPDGSANASASNGNPSPRQQSGRAGRAARSGGSAVGSRRAGVSRVVPSNARKSSRRGREASSSSDEADGKDIYIVEGILNYKVEDGEDLYLVKWKGYPVEQATWEPTENLLFKKNFAFQREMHRLKAAYIRSPQQSRARPAAANNASGSCPPSESAGMRNGAAPLALAASSSARGEQRPPTSSPAPWWPIPVESSSVDHSASSSSSSDEEEEAGGEEDADSSFRDAESASGDSASESSSTSFDSSSAESTKAGAGTRGASSSLRNSSSSRKRLRPPRRKPVEAEPSRKTQNLLREDRPLRRLRRAGALATPDSSPRSQVLEEEHGESAAAAAEEEALSESADRGSPSLCSQPSNGLSGEVECGASSVGFRVFAASGEPDVVELLRDGRDECSSILSLVAPPAVGVGREFGTCSHQGQPTQHPFLRDQVFGEGLPDLSTPLNAFGEVMNSSSLPHSPLDGPSQPFALVETQSHQASRSHSQHCPFTPTAEPSSRLPDRDSHELARLLFALPGTSGGGGGSLQQRPLKDFFGEADQQQWLWTFPGNELSSSPREFCAGGSPDSEGEAASLALCLPSYAATEAPVYFAAPETAPALSANAATLAELASRPDPFCALPELTAPPLDARISSGLEGAKVELRVECFVETAAAQAARSEEGQSETRRDRGGAVSGRASVLPCEKLFPGRIRVCRLCPREAPNGKDARQGEALGVDADSMEVLFAVKNGAALCASGAESVEVEEEPQLQQGRVAECFGRCSVREARRFCPKALLDFFLRSTRVFCGGRRGLTGGEAIEEGADTSSNSTSSSTAWGPSAPAGALTS